MGKISIPKHRSRQMNKNKTTHKYDKQRARTEANKARRIARQDKLAARKAR